MKKLVCMICVGMMMVMLAAGCAEQKKGDTYKVAIVQLVDNSAFSEMISAFENKMRELGYTEDKMTFEVKNAQGDMSTLNSICAELKNADYDLIVPIVTPAAQAVMSETTDIPIIFAAVTDPVDAGLVEDLNNPGGNVSGTSDEVSAEAIMNLANEITPEFKTIGALYSTGEDNSDSVIKGLKEYAAANGYEVVESTVTNTSEVLQATQFLEDKVDIVYSPIDNTVASAMAVATEVCNKAKIPFYVSADSMVQDGGLATYGIDYTVLGKETGKMVAEIFGGADVSAMPVVKMSDMTVYVNTKTADAIGVEIPQSVMDKATVLE